MCEREISIIMAQGSWPQLATTTGLDVRPEEDPTFSMALTTSIPSTTFPNTTCFPSSHSVFVVHMKNWDPFVPGPALAMDRIPGPVCFFMKFSSANFAPYMDSPPVPFPAVKSPPLHERYMKHSEYSLDLKIIRSERNRIPPTKEMNRWQ